MYPGTECTSTYVYMCSVVHNLVLCNFIMLEVIIIRTSYSKYNGCVDLYSCSLCIVHIQHVRLDAVYYYMRSLMAKVPFQSAHDSLIGIFEDTSRKVSLDIY